MSEKKYEYHKQNDYPGERVAEKKRVADRAEAADKKSDARVANRARMDDEEMNQEKYRSSAKAERINRSNNAIGAAGLILVAGLVFILLTGSVWGYIAMRNLSNEIDSLNLKLDTANADSIMLSDINRNNCGTTDINSPTILYMTPLTSVSPSNNELEVALQVPITIMFSEDMDPLTINEETFKVLQRTTPKPGSDADQYRSLPIEGTVTYNNRQATFISNERFSPSQMNGNVFTVTVTKGMKDLAGNSLMNDYIWSFSTGNYPFNTDDTTQQMG